MDNLRGVSIKKIFGLLLICLFWASGCWDAKEIQNLAIVSAIGIDDDEQQPGKVMVTVQIIKPGETKSAAAGEDSGGGNITGSATGPAQAYVIANSSGKTVSEAFQNFVSQVDRELFLSDNQLIVFGKKAAQKGIYPYLDFFIRTREPREIAWILVADGKAADIIAVRLGLEKTPAQEIIRLINNREIASQTSAATVQDFVMRLTSKETAAYASFIEICEVAGEKKISMAGTAVFKGDKYIGRLDKVETRGLLWITNKVKRGNISVKSGTLGEIDFEIINATSKMLPELKDGKIKIKLMIDTIYRLSSELKIQDLSRFKTGDYLERLIRPAIRREVYAAFRKAIQLQADVFGFGEAIHRKFPREWKRLKPDWEQIFATTRLHIQIKTRLKSAGFMTGTVMKE